MKNSLLIFVLLMNTCATAQSQSSEKQNLQLEIAAYQLHTTDTLVDVGCGRAKMARSLAKYHPGLFLVLEDLPQLLFYTKSSDTTRSLKVDTRKQVAKNMRGNNHYQLVLGTPESIPLPTASAKKVLCRLTLHEFKNRAAMVAELKRVLANDGELIIAEAAPAYPGHTDKYCKSNYLTTDEIKKIFADMHLLRQVKVNYSYGDMNIMTFAKATVAQQ